MGQSDPLDQRTEAALGRARALQDECAAILQALTETAQHRMLAAENAARAVADAERAYVAAGKRTRRVLLSEV